MDKLRLETKEKYEQELFINLYRIEYRVNEFVEGYNELKEKINEIRGF